VPATALFDGGRAPGMQGLVWGAEIFQELKPAFLSVGRNAKRILERRLDELEPVFAGYPLKWRPSSGSCVLRLLIKCRKVNAMSISTFAGGARADDRDDLVYCERLLTNWENQPPRFFCSQASH